MLQRWNFHAASANIWRMWPGSSNASGSKRQIRRDDLTCPQCEYSLRGLEGTVVCCPECGQRCDVAALMTRRWVGPWYSVPGFNQLLMPVAWMSLTALVLFVVGVMEMRGSGRGQVTLMVALGILLGWGLLLRGAWRVFPDGSGLRLSLLAHAIFAGYLVGMIGAAVGLLRFVIFGMPVLMVIGSCLVLAMLVLMVLCRRGERFIAEQCMRQYLNSTSAGPSPGGAPAATPRAVESHHAD